MQKYFSILVLFITFSINVQANSSCGFVSITQDGCCVRFEVNANSYSDYQIDMGDGTVLYDEDSPDNTFEYCYSGPGSYLIRLGYFDLNGDLACGSAHFITITQAQAEECKPTTPCVSFLCWEDFAGYFKCATEVVLLIPDGSTVTVPFVNISSGDGSWCTSGTTFPIPNIVPVVGGHCEIGIQIVNAIQSLGYDVDMNETGPEDDCFKGGSPIPGFFIYSDVQVLVVNGVDCDGGNPQDGNPFTQENCD